MEKTQLKMDCKKHGNQNAVSTMGGNIYCAECQKIWQLNRDKEEQKEKQKTGEKEIKQRTIRANVIIGVAVLFLVSMLLPFGMYNFMIAFVLCIIYFVYIELYRYKKVKGRFILIKERWLR